MRKRGQNRRKTITLQPIQEHLDTANPENNILKYTPKYKKHMQTRQNMKKNISFFFGFCPFFMKSLHPNATHERALCYTKCDGRH